MLYVRTRTIAVRERSPAKTKTNIRAYRGYLCNSAFLHFFFRLFFFCCFFVPSEFSWFARQSTIIIFYTTRCCINRNRLVFFIFIYPRDLPLMSEEAVNFDLTNTYLCLFLHANCPGRFRLSTAIVGTKKLSPNVETKRTCGISILKYFFIVTQRVMIHNITKY